MLVYDALRMKNTIQIIGLCMCNVGLLIYGAVQVNQINTAVNELTSPGYIKPEVWGQSKPFLIVIPCLVGVGSILMTFVAWKLYDEFAWTIYKHISADLRMKRRYLTYQVRSATPHHSYDHILTCICALDLYCSAEVRFLFLPWIYDSIPGYRLV